MAEDIEGFIESGVDQLAGKVIEVGRDIEAGIVEGAEEVASWFGFGDGADDEDLDPKPASWQEPLAYRSYRSGQSLSARTIEHDDVRGGLRVTFLPFGRTGSEIVHGLLGPRTTDVLLQGEDQPIDQWMGNLGQVDEAAKTVDGRPVDAVVITIGINDLGFSGLVTRGILKASGEKRKQRVAGAKRRIAEDYSAGLDDLRAVVRTKLNPRKVFITEYPVGIFEEIATGAKRPCDVLASSVPNPATGTDFEGLNLDGPDARDFGEVGHLLNDKIREKANEFGWILVDGIEAGFREHGYCADTSFFVSAEDSCLNQGDFEGMLHPNLAGHAVTRDRIASAISLNLLVVDDWLGSALHMQMS